MKNRTEIIIGLIPVGGLALLKYLSLLPNSKGFWLTYTLLQIIFLLPYFFKDEKS